MNQDNEAIMIRVLVVDQSPLMCNMIASVLNKESDMVVMGQATTVMEALAQATECDVILAHRTLPHQDVLELAQQVATQRPETKLLVMGLPKSEPLILRYIEAGASGYVLCEESTPELIEKSRAVHGGQPLINPGVTAVLMSRIVELNNTRHDYNARLDRLTDLTTREREVLNLIAENLSNRQIADRLVVEVGTVKNHVHNILQKLDVDNRHQATAYVSALEEQKGNQASI
jgi:DNA-binding NarL/FixJ family response regulator